MKKAIFPSAIVLGLAVIVSAAPNDSLESGFRNPPASAKPQTWWHWMNGNITKEGITADLEAMKQIGLGGATIVNVDCGIPPGPVKFMSPEWREHFKFAAQEADRLGLELCMENCAGWSSSGGPWNTVTNAMQRLTSCETNVHGPATFDALFPKPPTTLNYYRDIAVLAFRAPALKPKTVSAENSSPGKFEIKRAVYEGQSGGSADVTAKIVERIQRGQKSMPINNGELGGDPAEGQYKQLRLEFMLDGKADTLIVDENGTLIFPLSQTQLAAARAQQKQSFDRTFVQPPRASDSDFSDPIPQAEIVDLSGNLSIEGRLKWKVPSGDWTIVRFGYTPIGVENHPSPKEGLGLECDKMSKVALDAHWNGFMAKILDDIGSLAGKSVNCSLVDSYEVGNQDWTENFRAEFRKRRGYDPLKFLPTFTRRVVNSPEITERFLWDMRRTVADLFADNYFGHFAELCRQRGLLSAVEPYTGPFESLQSGATADVVMGEFWTGTQGHPSVKLAASLAHIYGKTIVGAESFTTGEQAGRWQNDPYSLKPLGDLMFCQGLNRYIFHRYAMQPWTNRWPGMTMGEYGLHFERTLTWWELGKAWIDYIARCQFLLQQGRAVADVAYFTGEGAPMEMRVNDPTLPAGYDYDAVDADVLLDGAEVKNGRITLRSGASYAALVLPPGDTSMTPQLLKRISELVRDGATVVGRPPKSSPSLADYPACDEQVTQLAEKLWGTSARVDFAEHRFGKGQVVWGKSLADILTAQNLRPDFEVHSPKGAKIAYAHRVAAEADIYFVSNQRQRAETVECTFRVAGKVPELWHPDTSIVESASVWSEHEGRTTVRLQLDPAGSVFVVFRRKAEGVVHAVATSREIGAQPELKILRGVYAAVDGAGEMDVTEQLSEKVDDGQLVVHVSNSTFGRDPANQHRKVLKVDYTLDGKPGKATVHEGETLKVPSVANIGVLPQWETIIARDGSPMVKSWTNGIFALTLSDGEKFQAVVKNLPSPRTLEGAWKLNFPPGSGAPPAIELDELISWDKHMNNGLRYFSGTATYEKDVEVTADRLAAGRELWLDLGRVENFAEVIWNGQSLGTLWKPPFRVNVTAHARAGSNTLVVKVTNLWPNRLIGDEQLPPDCEWDGNRLKAFPQWLLEGKPSPTGRFTFATWRYYTKNSSLLESGLLGPVKLLTAELNPAPPAQAAASEGVGR